MKFHDPLADECPEMATLAEPGLKSDAVPDCNICVGVLGVGYVGETLLSQFGRHFECIGFDINIDRIQALTSRFKSMRNVHLTHNPALLARASHFFISVPTPLRNDQSVNLDCVAKAVNTVLDVARPGACIVIESSVPVGTTRNFLGQYEDAYRCGMSPERIDPGRALPSAEDIPKIVSGLTPEARNQICSIYSRVYNKVVPVSTPEVAEMTKLYENCYRMVNIAYVNEVSDACRSHGIDPGEMIDAASTKPFGFQAFHPGLGVGGHCISVNPYYLFANNRPMPVLKRATEVMQKRPAKLARHFYQSCVKEMQSRRLDSMPHILIVGVGFKAGQSDLSGSPSLSFARTLDMEGCARLAFYDPLVEQRAVDWMEKLDESCWNSTYVDAEFDAVAICTQQDKVDMIVTERLRRTFLQTFVWSKKKADLHVPSVLGAKR